MKYLSTLVLVIVTLAACADSRAQEPAAETAPAAEPEPSADERAAAERTASLQQLAAANGDEYRELGKGDEHAEVLITAVRKNQDTGILLLIPGDGLKPTTSPGLAQLRRHLPDHGWNIWLLALERPPLVNMRYLDPPAEPASEAPTDGEAPASDSTATDADGSTSNAKTLDERDAQAWTEWLEIVTPRVALAASEARSNNAGKLIIVAENEGESGALAALRDDPALADGVILISSVSGGTADKRWPEPYPEAVLEIMSPLLNREHGNRLRDDAIKAGIPKYEQAVIEYADWPLDDSRSPLIRRTRGWLKRLVDGQQP